MLVNGSPGVDYTWWIGLYHLPSLWLSAWWVVLTKITFNISPISCIELRSIYNLLEVQSAIAVSTHSHTLFMICQYIPFYAIGHNFDILYPVCFYRLTHVSTSEEDCPWFWRLGYAAQRGYADWQWIIVISITPQPFRAPGIVVARTGGRSVGRTTGRQIPVALSNPHFVISDELNYGDCTSLYIHKMEIFNEPINMAFLNTSL